MTGALVIQSPPSNFLFLSSLFSHLGLLGVWIVVVISILFSSSLKYNNTSPPTTTTECAKWCGNQSQLFGS